MSSALRLPVPSRQYFKVDSTYSSSTGSTAAGRRRGPGTGGRSAVRRWAGARAAAQWAAGMTALGAAHTPAHWRGSGWGEAGRSAGRTTHTAASAGEARRRTGLVAGSSVAAGTLPAAGIPLEAGTLLEVGIRPAVGTLLAAGSRPVAGTLLGAGSRRRRRRTVVVARNAGEVVVARRRRGSCQRLIGCCRAAGGCWRMRSAGSQSYYRIHRTCRWM